MFSHYFPLPDSYFTALWKDCIFALDANVLLDLYRYSESTRDELLEIFEELGGRIWIPHQAALEFARNRPKVISDQADLYDRALSVIQALKEQAKKEIYKSLQFRLHPMLDKDKLLTSINSALDKVSNPDYS